MTDHSKPPDQDLRLQGASLLAHVDEDGTNVMLQLDVAHIETGHRWKQSLHMTEDQLDLLIKLGQYYQEQAP